MDIKLARCFVAVDDHDRALAFNREVHGPEVRDDVGFEGTPRARSLPRAPSRTRP
ncbi:hypothetical protein GCM10010274_46140 [Streptomyces lavendofoliae]|uniref:Uncharacterized protein n=1 Tax=Streptomyces lavendofoliae TaxID=67314 RepID=A0A918M5K4_9ACTN|nr:hypothetical protein GCM10010274_46140 [Streptomyces lavendofoliae]